MPEQISRRETLRAGLAASSLLALLPDWAVPALAQGDTDVPFTDIPKNFDPNNPNSRTRILDIRKIDDVGRAIDAALAGGANSIGSLQFTASNADSARREALARATVQARGDAEVLARSAGGTLGPLIELTASGDNGIRPIMYARAMAGGAAAAPTPIDAGPITISVSVSARWQFVPANR